PDALVAGATGGGRWLVRAATHRRPGLSSLKSPRIVAPPTPSDGLFSLPATGGPVARVGPKLPYMAGPAVSPDGLRVAFVGGLDAEREIFVMNADGTKVVQLTHNAVPDGSPTWSPDGSKIAFFQEVGHSGDIFVMNADG